MDITQLYMDYGVPFKTEGHKHCRPGWVNTACPFCSGNEGFHLGYNVSNNIFVCWRCGWHPIIKTLEKLLHVETKEIYFLLKNYSIYVSHKNNAGEIKIRVKSHKLPSNIKPLQTKHKNYLIKRNFDPDKLEKEWNLMATGPVSFLDHHDYRFRIIAPIIWNNQQVSFQGRDVTGKTELRYKACPEDRELIKHKELIYCKQEKLKETGLCVEGITDVWRFGVVSFATFGIKYTPAQLRLIAKTFKRVPVLYDPDPQAKEQAKKLSAELRFRGIDSFPVDINVDPGEMKQEEADYLVKQLI